MAILEEYLETVKNPLVVVGVEYGDIEIIDQPINHEYYEKLKSDGIKQTRLETAHGEIYCLEHDLSDGLPINMNMLPFFFVGEVVISPVPLNHTGEIMQNSVKKSEIINIIRWIYDNGK